MTDPAPFSRRGFLAHASCFGAFYVAARYIPVPALPGHVSQDSRVSQIPVLDKGFVSIRKIGDGLYASISDTSKGFQTICNGGFLVGRDAALLIESFGSPQGASVQVDALRSVSKVPIKAALDTHYHFDHSMGGAFYGANGIPLWAHATAAKRMFDSYSPLQGAPKEVALAAYEKRVRDAKSDIERQHAQGDLGAMTSVFQNVNSCTLGLPNHPIDPASLPLTVDLGGLLAVLESYPGHSGTDIIARVPSQSVVYAGDLLFNGWYPVVFDERATVSGWRETLKRFSAFDKDTLFVPGHGQICGQEGIARIRDVFDDIAGQAEKMFKAGVPVEDAEHHYVIPEQFKNFPVFSWGFTIGPAITKLYAEWRKM